MYKQPIVVAITILSYAATAAGQTVPTECSAGYLPATSGPSEARFVREVLFPSGTAFTHEFDGDSGSYVVNKRSLATAFPVAAKACGLRPWGLVIVGPVGPMWSYWVYGLLRDGDTLVVNAVTTRHGRVLYKGFVRTQLAQAVAFDTLIQLPFVVRGQPPRPAGDPMAADFSYSFLAVRYDPSLIWWRGRVPESDRRAAGRLDRAMAFLHRGAVETYAHMSLPRFDRQ